MLHKSNIPIVSLTVFISLVVLQFDSVIPLANSEQNLPATDMFLSVLQHTATKTLRTIESIEGELFCLKLSDEKAT